MSEKLCKTPEFAGEYTCFLMECPNVDTKSEKEYNKMVNYSCRLNEVRQNNLLRKTACIKPGAVQESGEVYNEEENRI